MVKNKDMKKELQNVIDSFFQNKDEENLIKELKINLEIFRLLTKPPKYQWTY